MNDFSIFIDTSSQRFLSEIRGERQILSNIHIQVNGQPFPSDPWLDFPVIVLTWWLEGYVALIKDEDNILNAFMNGPFEFVTKRIKKNNVRLTFHKIIRVGNIEARSPAEITLSEYKEGLVAAAKHLLNILDSHSKGGPAVNDLRKALNSVLSAHSE